MQDSNHTETSYSPSLWAAQDSGVQDYGSPFDIDRINSPFAGTPLNAQVEQNAFESAIERPNLRKRRQTPRKRLPLLRLEDWDRERVYDEDPPICVHYFVEWTVFLNDKKISKNSERNVVLEPASFWHVVLRPRLDRLVEKKINNMQKVRASEGSVVASVTARGVHDFTNEFDGLDIDWTDISSQLIEWSILFQDGKQLRVELIFHYRSLDEPVSVALERSGRGRSSVTQQMHRERNARLQAEEESEGRVSVWTEVYQLMRCPVACPRGPHCLVDDDPEKTHYKLYTHHLRQLVKHKLGGGKLESHADVPNIVREELYAEAEKAVARKRKSHPDSPNRPVPVTINNHFSEQSNTAMSSMTRTANEHRSAGLQSPVFVTDHHDTAVQKYSKWLQSRYHGSVYKEAIAAAERIVQERMLGLDHIHEDRKWQFLEDEGIPVGIARRFVSDIKLYFRHLGAG